MSTYIEMQIGDNDGIADPACTYPKVRIELSNETLTLPEVVEYLIRPSLVASGFSERAVNEYFNK